MFANVRLRLECLEDRRVPAMFLVTTTADDGPGSLRQAIIDADKDAGPNTIAFALSANDHTIAPLSPLPVFTTPTTLDGATQPGRRVGLAGPGSGTGLHFVADATVRDLVIRGWTLGIDAEHGVRNLTVTDCRIVGNATGIDSNAGVSTVAGNHVESNGTGVLLDLAGDGGLVENNRVLGNATGIHSDGGPATIQDNTVRGNGTGVVVEYARSVIRGNTVTGNTGAGIDVSSAGQQVLGNFVRGNGGNGITLDYDGSNNLAAGNAVLDNGGDGIYLGPDRSTVRGNRIVGNRGNGVNVAGRSGFDGPYLVLGNTIADSGGDGVRVALARGASILENSITNSGRFGIELVGTSNDGQAAPVLGSAVPTRRGLTVTGVLNSAPDATFTLEFFASPAADPNGAGEGRAWLGDATVTTDAGGHADFTATLRGSAGPGGILTATATNAAGSTSAFSAWVPVGADLLASLRHDLPA